MGATKQKSTIDTQRKSRMESKHITTENHQFIKEGSKKGRKQKWNYKYPEEDGISICKSLHINNYLMLMV